MIQLTDGGTDIDFHRGVFWSNEFSEPRKKEDEFVDLDGATVVQSTTLTGGRRIVLLAKGSETRARSYFTRAQVEQIEAWEISGAILTFTYGSKVLSVRVPPNPLSVTPLRDMEGHTADDIYYGSITLAEVIL